MKSAAVQLIVRWFTVAICVMAMSLTGLVPVAHADEKSDAQAAALLAEAKKAYTEKQFNPAREEFARYIKEFAAGKEINAAHLGLAIVILEGPRANGPDGMDRDYPGAITSLQAASADAAYADRALAIYYLGHAQRELGLWQLKQAALKPNEADAIRTKANGQFEAAGKSFVAAVAAFVERAKAAPAQANGPLPEDYEWAARARCDVADMLLRTGKSRESMVITQPFLKDEVLTRSKACDLGRYLHGLAAYTAGDQLTAVRSLALLAPFTDRELSVHSRYLLARIHHQAQERPEASALYDALLADFESQIIAARAIVNDGNALRDNPRERARLESLVRDPLPDHIEQANFYYASLLMEQGQTAAAIDRFNKFRQQFPKSPLAPEAQLLQGQALIKANQPAEAVRVLTPLQDHTTFACDARWAMGKATASLYDPNNPQQKQQALAAALGQYRIAAERAGKAEDAAGKQKLAAILLDLGDAQLANNLAAEAVPTFEQIIARKLDVEMVEVAQQRLVTALHMAGRFADSDRIATAFETHYPRSALLAPVLFRHAENSFMQAQLAANLPDNAGKPQAWQPLYEQAIARYAALLAKHPAFEQAGLARLSQGISLMRIGQYEKAAAVFAAIGSTERAGDLAIVSFLQADCLLRLAPTDVSDALSAGKALQMVSDAIKLLEAYIPGNEQKPEGAIALLKLGECNQRIAAIMADPQEKAKALVAALTIFQGFPTRVGANHPLLGEALLGRCNTLVMMGDLQGAMSRLPRFQSQDPYTKSPIVPLALTRLASLMVSQNQAEQAAALLTTVRQQHEANLLKDANRAAWVPLIQMEHALALRASGKLTESQALYESIAKNFPDAMEASEAKWRSGQVRFEIAKKSIVDAQLILAKPDRKPEEATAAVAAIENAKSQLAGITSYFESLAAAANTSSASRLSTLYDAAWCQRLLGQLQLTAIMDAKRQAALEKLEAAAKAAALPNQPPLPVYPTPISTASIPLQPAQLKAIALYAAMVEVASDAPLAIRARFEQAEIYAARGQHDAAIPLLSEAIDLEPEQPLLDELHLRLGACLIDKGDLDGAIEQFSAAISSKSPAIYGEAYFRLAEAKIAGKDFDGAIKLLTPFRDKGEFQNIPGITDRALLRLGHAYAYANQWEPSRQAMETLLGRFGNSPYRFEARLGYANARQQQKNWDDAINHYREAAKAVTLNQPDIAARAMLGMGLCFNEKKQPAEALKVLLPIVVQFDDANHIAAALLEAARSQIELKQSDAARELLNRVIKDHANTPWAVAAQQRLDQIKQP